MPELLPRNENLSGVVDDPLDAVKEGRFLENIQNVLSHRFADVDSVVAVPCLARALLRSVHFAQVRWLKMIQLGQDFLK